MSRINSDGAPFDRRSLLSAAAGLAATAVATPALSAETENALKLAAARADSGRGRGKTAFPYDTFRDWMQALDDDGLLMRIPRLDQDAYEATALAYRLMDTFGWYGAPAVIADEVKINGQWVKGPLIFNHQGHWDTEALLFGLEPVPGQGTQTYRNVLDHFTKIVDVAGGKMPGNTDGGDPARAGARQGIRPAGRRRRSHEVRLHPVQPGRRGSLHQHRFGLHL